MALFIEQGYEATTVDQIAKGAGVSPATLFRHFPSKEDVLFGDEDNSAAAMVQHVAERSDRSITVAALAEPVARFAADLQGEDTPRLTHLVMTNRSLEARSLRMRLRWERDIARQLAAEQDFTSPTLDHTLIASIAVSCLSTALRYWDKSNASIRLADLVNEAFDRCAHLPPDTV
ncbi:TetR/AcrR family transcriptional regulator [Streptomyces sp. CME 23]|nr:TetR/AcrR family transcriptional regulator [Streptomyces sp. CME 23]